MRHLYLKRQIAILNLMALNRKIFLMMLHLLKTKNEKEGVEVQRILRNKQ